MRSLIIEEAIPTIRRRMALSEEPVLVWVAARLDDRKLLRLAQDWAEHGAEALVEIRDYGEFLAGLESGEHGPH